MAPKLFEVSPFCTFRFELVKFYVKQFLCLKKMRLISSQNQKLKVIILEVVLLLLLAFELRHYLSRILLPVYLSNLDGISLVFLVEIDKQFVFKS